MSTRTRPTLLDGLVRRGLGPEGEVILGDLDEEWEDRLAEHGLWRARVWYLRAAVSSISSIWGGRVMGGWKDVRAGSGATWAGLLRHEARALRRAPLWSGLAVGTLAVGMLFAVVVHGFSVALGENLLPYPELDRVVYIAESNSAVGAVADPTLRRLQDRDDVFEAVMAWTQPSEANLSRGSADPTVVRVTSVLPGTPEALGLTPIRGRSLETADEIPSEMMPALISWGWWVRDFGADPAAVGEQVQINGRLYVIAGVLPPNAVLPGAAANGPPADVWLPILRLPFLETDPGLRYQVATRVRPGVDADEVRRVGEGIMETLRGELPGWRTDPAWRIMAVPLREQFAGPAEKALESLIAAALLLLGLGSANLVALTLARAQGRQREFEVHMALGASPSSGLKRLLIQNGLVALLAAVIAVPAGAGVMSLARDAGVSWLAGLEGARLHPGTVLAAGIIAIVISLSVALLTAWIGRFLLRPATRGLHARGTDRRWRWVGRGLVLVETAMVVALAVGAGLMARTFSNLSSVDPGLQLADRFATRVSVAGPRWSDQADVRALTEQFADRIAAIPGVQTAAVSTSAPLSSTIWNFGEIEGAAPGESGELPTVQIDQVSPGYLATLGIEPSVGRTLSRVDLDPSSEPAVVVNQSLADLFPEAALGGRIRFGERAWMRVVGVVPDVPAGRLDEPAGPKVYLTDLAQAFPWTTSTYWFLIEGSPASTAGQLQQSLSAALAEFDPTLPLHPVRPLTDMRADLLQATRVRMMLFGILGLVALTLGAGGIYGVVSHSLGSARHETGVRLALGATRGRVFVGTVTAEAVAVIAGASGGVFAAWQLGRLLSGFLFGVGPIQGDLYLIVLALVGTVATVAIVAPAWRAANSDPVASLRSE